MREHNVDIYGAVQLAGSAGVAGQVLLSAGPGAQAVWGANGGTFTSGAIIFAGATGNLSEDPTQLFWDNANNRLGIGTSTPNYALDVDGGIRNRTAADAAPYTMARIWVYGGTGVDTNNWAYLGYGADTQLRIVYGKSGVGSVLFGTSTAPDGTGTFDYTTALGTYGINFQKAGVATSYVGTDGSGSYVGQNVSHAAAWAAVSTAAASAMLYIDINGDFNFYTRAPSAAGNAFGTQKLILTNAGDLKLQIAGTGLFVKEGTNATMGTETLIGGTAVVNTTKVTANSRIFLTINGGTLTNVGSVYVAARTAGTSFTITSLNILDTSAVAWVIVEPS